MQSLKKKQSILQKKRRKKETNKTFNDHTPIVHPIPSQNNHQQNKPKDPIKLILSFFYLSVLKMNIKTPTFFNKELRRPYGIEEENKLYLLFSNILNFETTFSNIF
jgi:hypothetical protein